MSSRLLSGAGQTESPMVVCSFTDVTDRKAAEAQLHWLAYHDSLTGLGNRSFFNDELERELLVSMQRGHQPGRPLHRPRPLQAGQRLLRPRQRRRGAAGAGPPVQVGGPQGRRRQPVLAATSSWCCARNVRDRRARRRPGHGVLDASTEAPFKLSTGRYVVVTCSVGCGLRRCGAARAAQDILQQADIAMFQAKNKGRSRIEVFDESLRANSVARLEIYDDLRHSIDHDELVVHYQPIASVRDGSIVAMEALVRWNHPTRGLLGPMEFIPFAEETDLIFSLGRWVLREACQTMARWRREVPGAEDAYITVNLSVHQLSDADAARLHRLGPGRLRPAARGPGAGGHRVAADERHLGDRRRQLGGIHEMGVGLAIDDFGTGESSLAQLKRFPVKVLKIDKSFVDGLGDLRERRGHRGRHRPAVQGPRPGGAGRGGGDARAAPTGGRARVRPLPGLPDVPAHQADSVDFSKQAETTSQTDLPA